MSPRCHCDDEDGHNGFFHEFTIFYAPCFVLFEYSGNHNPISVLINVFMLLAYLSTQLVLTLTMGELHHWLSTAGMLHNLYMQFIYIIYIYMYTFIYIIYII